jgi:hypothetical protein
MLDQQLSVSGLEKSGKTEGSDTLALGAELGARLFLKRKVSELESVNS